MPGRSGIGSQPGLKPHSHLLKSDVANRPTCRAALVAALLITASPPARAQLYESVGTRAQGMAGAFVAVSDDATTTWWNPAGLAVAPLFSGVVEHRRAWEGTGGETLGISFAIPSLGLSYYRLRIREVQPAKAIEALGAGRQDQGTAGTRPSTHVLTQFGATVGQSLGDYLVVGSTLKLIRADQTRGDLDVGAMGKVGSVRVAVVMKHVWAPEMTADGTPVVLDRQVRVGVAYMPPLAGTVSVTTALDADLTRTATEEGEERRLAGGIEMWLSRRVGLRGGMSASTLGNLRRSVSGGASLALQKGLYVDAQATRGDDEPTRGWGLALRLTF